MPQPIDMGVSPRISKLKARRMVNVANRKHLADMGFKRTRGIKARKLIKTMIKNPPAVSGIAPTSVAAPTPVAAGGIKGVLAKAGSAIATNPALTAAGLGALHLGSTAMVAKHNLEAPEKKIARFQAKQVKKGEKLSQKKAKMKAKYDYSLGKLDTKHQKDVGVSKAKQKYYKHFVDSPKNEELSIFRNFILENSNVILERISRGAKGATIGMALGSAPGAFIGHQIGKFVEPEEDKAVRKVLKASIKGIKSSTRDQLKGLKQNYKAKVSPKQSFKTVHSKQSNRF